MIEELHKMVTDYKLWPFTIFAIICILLSGCQPATTLCKPIANPFPTLEPIDIEALWNSPNINVNQVCTLKGQVKKGQTYKHQITPNLVFCLIPTHPLNDEITGWHLIISDKMEGEWCGDNFAPIVTPPFHGQKLFDIHGWQFRNKDNTGENDGSVNEPQKVRQFNFLLNENAYKETQKNDQCALGGVDCPTDMPPGKNIDTPIIPKSVGVLTITDLKLGNLIPNKMAWIESMEFEVKVYLP